MSHFGRSGPPDIRDTYSLLVLNITFRTTADDLYPLFAKYGKVVDIFIPRDRRTGESRGFAFVRYKYADEAQAAVDRLDGRTVDGRDIMVQFAKYGPNAEPIHKGRIVEALPKSKGRSRSRSPRPRQTCSPLMTSDTHGDGFCGLVDYCELGLKWFCKVQGRYLLLLLTQRALRYRDDYRDRDYRRRSRSRSRGRYDRDNYRDRERDYRRRSSRSTSPDYHRGRGRGRSRSQSIDSRSPDYHKGRARERSVDRGSRSRSIDSASPARRSFTPDRSLSPRKSAREDSPGRRNGEDSPRSPSPCRSDED